MPSAGRNFLFLLSDQHTRRAMGCMGHRLVETPHMDRLAERGTLFTNAYTNAPICVPARAALATGQQVFEIGKWDNCQPYRGEQAAWGHRLRQASRTAVSIGKLHYRQESDPNGFDQSLLPLHIIDGVGMLTTILRDPLPRGKKFFELVMNAGAGESSYTDYDLDITDRTIAWLHNEAPKRDKPWALFVSMVCPHPPWLAPDTFYQRYPLDRIELPMAYATSQRPRHPGLDDFRHTFGVEGEFEEATLRKVIAAYYGMITYLDTNIGRILEALDASGEADSTDILYSSDHGESMGEKGMFSKCNMFEESVGIPMIFAGADIPRAAQVDTPTQLIDVFPTILESTQADAHDEDEEKRGASLQRLANGERLDRTIIAEQHSAGCRSAVFMARHDNIKYVHYVDYAPELYDLGADPFELNNLGERPEHQPLVADMEARLRAVVDPDAVDTQVKADQAERIEAAGGAEAIAARGSHGYTPAPGETPNFG
ncbi:MAG: sulfatase-like hydrolase/transferase [Pseudomonadota bacterium]